jgi:hypothetical protein
MTTLAGVPVQQRTFKFHKYTGIFIILRIIKLKAIVSRKFAMLLLASMES